MNIFLVGPMGSGKDQVASVLPCHTRIALGDPIRLLGKNLRINGVSSGKLQLSQMASPLPRDIDEKLRYFRDIPMNDAKDRRRTQELGTYLRQLKDDIWIAEALKAMKQRKSYVVTDVRRESEFAAFTNEGFVSIWVEASDELRKQRLIDRDGRYDEQWETNVAELEIKGLKGKCQYTVLNNGSLEDLRVEVDALMAWIDFDMTN